MLLIKRRFYTVDVAGDEIKVGIPHDLKGTELAAEITGKFMQQRNHFLKIIDT